MLALAENWLVQGRLSPTLNTSALTRLRSLEEEVLEEKKVMSKGMFKAPGYRDILKRTSMVWFSYGVSEPISYVKLKVGTE